jgi:hypothetical protein
LQVIPAADQGHSVLEHHPEALNLRVRNVLLERLVRVETVLGNSLKEVRAIVRLQVMVRKVPRSKIKSLILHLREQGNLVCGASLVARYILVDELLGCEDEVACGLLGVRLQLTAEEGGQEERCDTSSFVASALVVRP